MNVAFSPASHTLSGVILLTVTNHSEDKLGDVLLILYPNLYREPDPALDRTQSEAIYPREFNPGSITLTTVETDDGGALQFGIVDGAGPHMLARVFLPQPLPPERSIRLRVGFTTVIPEKFGVFGQFHGVTVVQGGWYPYVPAFREGEWAVDMLPDPAQFLVRITTPRGMTVAGAEAEPGDPQSETTTWIHRSERSTTVALAFSPSYLERVEQDGPTRLRYFFLPPDRRYVAKIMETLRHGLAFYRREYGNAPIPEVVLAAAYLHQNLVSPHEGVSLVSTRLFQVFWPLQKYHEAELIKSLLFALWRARLPDEEAWVLEGLAEAGSQLYMKDRYRHPPNLLRLLKPFSFYPLVDQILYSKKLPLRQVYFKEATPIIPREDIALFNNRRPDGSTMLFKLTALLGQPTIDNLLHDYVELVTQHTPRPFREVAQETTNRDLEWFYRQWLSVNPSTDYAIASVTEERRPDGYHTTLAITRTGEGIEPVAIRLRQRRGPPLTTTWLSYEPSYQETFVTPSPVTVVHLDPDHKTSDPQRFNDRQPPAIKFILENFPGFSYDLQTKNLSYDFSAYFQRLYDEDNILRFSYSKSDTSTAATAGFGHSYDSDILSYLTRQSLSLAVSYSKQNIPLATSASTAPFTALHLTHTVSNAKTPLIYSADIQRLVFGNIPYSTFTTDLAQKVVGSPHPHAIKLRLDIHRQWPVATLHEVAGRAVVGQSLGGLHEERRYDLGGSGGMRGYSPTNLSGESIVLGSLEYRYPLIRELETNLGGITVLRRLQAAAFADIGTVSSYSRYRTDVGVGLRLTHDFLGLYPVVTRFDVAFPIHVEESLKPKEQAPHFYLTAGQPF
ncbi:MAG: BamA/TamA family outer membrane protein [Nitrospirae bacterium]|nr:BamA/TamA family outer membrane protein [Nitrospirota bacterium]